MKAVHDSRDIRYRTPYGAVRPGTSVTLCLDVRDSPGATATLRTWVDGMGERLYPMEPVAPADDGSCAENEREGTSVRFRATIVPDQAGIVWYHFIITESDGRQMRYGVLDGRRGGEGRLYDWEPPSFQLTVCDACKPASTDEIAHHAVERPFRDVFLDFLCGDISAPEFAEAYETVRENCPEEDFPRVVNVLDCDDRLRMLARLGNASIEDALDELEAAGLDGLDESDAADEGVRAADVMEGGQLGLAKGRLWCASIIQLLAVGCASACEGGCNSTAGADGASPYDRLISSWACEDPDCEAILRNATDVRFTLPLFGQKPASLFAVNEGVIGFWRHGDDGLSTCVLVNASLQHAYDVSVPMVDEGVCEVISGYGTPVAAASEIGDIPTVFEGAERYARVHLYQLGTAILLFHGENRLERALQEGVGVLAHITSLPAAKGRKGLGTLGAPVRSFVDWLADSGVRYWQILPVNPTDDHGSPYAGISAFAGNVRLLEGYPAFEDFEIDFDEYRAFCEREADWLEPYASFMAIRESRRSSAVWQDWPKRYRTFDKALIERSEDLSARAETWKRGQFVFEQQWKALRAYANERGVYIIGDMPIYVSSDSADVWANPHLFQLGSDGRPEVVAGCPPDAFAVEGQVWGNPVYDWDALAQDGYAWWLRRLERAFDLYDYVRLDHFIGFARYFSIPAGQKATAGQYRQGPGLALFEKAREAFGPLPVIAEDLGSITPSVRALVAACGFLGMDIVQFVDGGDPLSGYRPRPEKIAYTGTHDNQTLVGYCETRYPDLDADRAAEELIEKVARCDAPVRVFPLQDVLGLDDEARMNTPGTVEGNWMWQVEEEAIEQARERLRAIVRLGER